MFPWDVTKLALCGSFLNIKYCYVTDHSLFVKNIVFEV